MLRHLVIVHALVVVCSMTLEAAHGQDQTVYDVGVSKVDITPDYPIRLNGFGFRREESEGVSQRIFAKALAISLADEPPLVLIAIDSLGMRLEMVDEAATRLQKAYGIPRGNVALTFTHSHCAPKVNGACDNIFSQSIPEDHQRHIDRYSTELTDAIEQAARRAIESRAPATLEWGVGSAGFAMNRRTPGGPVDHDLPVLVVRDAESSETRAVYVSYACHCVTLSFNQISGDWAGHAAEMIEKNVPGSIALVSIGCGSDSNPSSGVTGDKTDIAAAQGAEIATEVARLLKSELRSVHGKPTATLRQIELPLNDPPSKEQLEATVAQGKAAGYNATTQLARLERGEALLTAIDYPVQTWSFGDSLVMVFLAGEVCVDYSLRLKSELDRDRLWLNGYSNDFCAYIPSERLLREGGYGGGGEIPYFALPTTLRAGLEQSIVDEVKRQVPASFRLAERTQGVPPKSPAESLQCLRTHDDLRVELAAAEPLIADPVAIDFGPDGRLWVAEMNDYGRGVYERFEQTGRLRWLRDNDGDGRFDEAHTFVEGLRFPTDVKVWRDGVLICDAPDILLASDVDGDGLAETRKLFTGFEVRNAQARVNSLRWGLDNWLYGACGLFGGQVTSELTGETVDISGRDFRLRPDTGQIEAVGGRTQQGRDRNDWGDWFGCSNSTLLTHFPIEDRYHRRNPRVAAPPTSISIANGPDADRLIPRGELVRFELSGAPGRATSACGLGIYRDLLLGEQYTGNAFTCEPVHQLVHRLVLGPQGVSFVGRRAANEADSEFLSSTDRWFRPVQIRTGPDGALWVVDMYRYVIEHPRWIPKETLQAVDVFAGQGRGRIYRVLPRAALRQREANGDGPLGPRLNKLEDDDLAAKLAHPNGVVRDLAQQMLIWRNATSAAPVLRKLLADDKAPLGQLHALSTLEGLGVMSSQDLEASLASPHSAVVQLAMRFAEGEFSREPKLLPAVIARADSPDAQVRLQTAYTLGESGDPRAARALVEMLMTADADAYQQAAVLSSITSRNVNGVMAACGELPRGRRDAGSMERLLPLAAELAEAASLASALNDAFGDSAKFSPRRVELLCKVLDAVDRRDDAGDNCFDASTIARLRGLYDEQAAILSAARSTGEEKAAALELLSRRPGPATKQILGSRIDDRPQWLRAIATLLSARQLANLRQQAIRALSRSGDDDAADLLLASWRDIGPATRNELVDALLSRETWTLRLLERIESGSIKPARLDAARRQKLLTHASVAVRERAAKALQASAPSNRREVLEAYRSAASLRGDAERGRVHFRKHCANCHRLEEHGHAVGPDLTAITNRSPDWLLTAMLDPNRDVDARYVGWLAILADGRAVNGLVREETASSIRLVEAENKEHVLLRDEIDELRSSDKSIMPEGIERDLAPRDVADVIAYVSTMLNMQPGEDAPLPRYPPDIGPFLLDESQSRERRQEVIDLRPGMGPAIVAKLVEDMELGGDEEYRRIPWIWRVAIAVGRRNDGGELRDLLDESLPRGDQPLRDWQAVVIGGGVINGLSQLGLWPDERLAKVLKGVPQGAERWQRALTLAADMADNPRIRNGTRYDALRMIALAGWDRRGQQLVRYLADGVDDELQMGAVSGLCDIQSEAVTKPMIEALPRLSERNRTLAIEALSRTEQRSLALLQAVQEGRVARKLVDRQAFASHPSPRVRELTTRVLP